MSEIISKRLWDLLLEEQYLTRNQLELALDIQKNTHKKLDEIVIDEGIILEEDIIDVICSHMGITRVRLDKMYVNPEVIGLLPEYLARKHTAFPVKRYGNILMVAFWNPHDVLAVDDIRLATGFDIQVVIATKKEINEAIQKYYSKTGEDLSVWEKVGNDYGNKHKLKDDADVSSPIVRMVNTMIQQAVKKGASDIHIEPQEKNVWVRYRIDGMLAKFMEFPKEHLMSVTARIKIMANLDITKKRYPQDGRIKFRVEKEIIDIRVSTMPTINGEKVVLRLLNRDKHLISIDQLGFNKAQREYLRRILEFSSGLVLVTGPVGSGKTTTLYSMINAINTPTKNIMTLEDPVEYSIPGINQIQINSKVGITFARGLRSILRQDPNVIMVGEIRDQETAQIAIRAALTGHLVFSTLHTNNTSGAIVRLIDMGVEPYLLASCLVGVIAQRLVRILCPQCKEEFIPQESTCCKGVEDNKVFYRAKGCPYCNNTGYKGRQVVGEMVILHEEHRQLISQKVSSSQLDMLSRKLGYKTFKENGMDLAEKGVTSIDELLRVLSAKSY